jgi:hypothetical protein
MGGEIYSTPVRYRIREEVRNGRGKYIPQLSVFLKSREEVRNGRRKISLSCQLLKQRKSGIKKEIYPSLVSFKKSERKLGMRGEIYPSPVS